MKLYKTPRLLLSDAYTIGSNKFESENAKDKSVYYLTFRRNLNKINPDLYTEGDNRIVFCGLSPIVDKLFATPVTHQEIDEALAFLAHAKVTMNGFQRYDCPEQLWREVVDKYNGYPPIEIKALPEGSVVYPNEPVVQVTSLVKGMGILAAWFESKLIHCWAPTERVTQNEHWFKYLCSVIQEIDPSLSESEVDFFAGIMLTDFGDRAAICNEESEILGMYSLLTFSGTDTFSGAYQVYKNSDADKVIGLYSSVNALAHRNVQSYENEFDCYDAIYNSCGPGEIISMVNDCYSSEHSVKNSHVKLALQAKAEGSGKVVVSRADSGDVYEELMLIINTAVENGLYKETDINGVMWKYAENLHFLAGDGLDFLEMKKIIKFLMDKKIVFYSWGLFGMGGGLRNGLKRDNLGTKYALCSVGEENIPVMKFSNTPGKVTLPGPFKVLRTQEALENRKTIVFELEEGEDARVVYYDGVIRYNESFTTIKDRVRSTFKIMPLTLETEDNHNYPASDSIQLEKVRLHQKYIG